MEVTGSDKSACFQTWGINYDHKKFYSFVPRSQFYTHFTTVMYGRDLAARKHAWSRLFSYDHKLQK
jgi:hypothetical protein